jgi:hypothetical protein
MFSLTQNDVISLYFADKMGISSEYTGFESGMLIVFFGQPFRVCDR